MPIEIRELHIRMSVTPRPEGSGEGASSPGTPTGTSATATDRAADEELVARCVEQVMEVLRTRGER